MVVSVAQGDPAAAGGGPPLHRARLRRASAAPTSPPTSAGTRYDRHTELIATLLDDLDLRDATVVVHDWGGPIGLRLAVEHPERIARIVILDTGLFTGEQPMTDAVEAVPRLRRANGGPAGSMLVRGATARGMGDEVAAAYDAPYPNPESKAGARAFPLMLPTTPEAPGAAAGKRVLEAMRERRAAEARPVGGQRLRSSRSRSASASPSAINAPPPEKIENASHFLQEDAGEEIGQRIAEWLAA